MPYLKAHSKTTSACFAAAIFTLGDIGAIQLVLVLRSTTKDGTSRASAPLKYAGGKTRITIYKSDETGKVTRFTFIRHKIRV